MNTIRMHRIERAVLQKIAWLSFAVAPHPLAFDALPPPPSFCLPPLVRCAPGDMQKSKSDLRKLERNEHDTYAQNRESVTAELRVRSWKVTFCSCSSSACFCRFAAFAFFMSSCALSRVSASSGSVRSWAHAKIKIPSRSVGEKLTRYACTELKDPNCTTLERCLLLLLLIRLLWSVRCLRLFSVLFCSVSPLCLLSFGALLGTCKNQNPISVSRREINAICIHRIDSP